MYYKQQTIQLPFKYNFTDACISKSYHNGAISIHIYPPWNNMGLHKYIAETIVHKRSVKVVSLQGSWDHPKMCSFIRETCSKVFSLFFSTQPRTFRIIIDTMALKSVCTFFQKYQCTYSCS